ncbi:MAG TPA: phage major capsid protein [Gaiellales bacterium]
MDKKHDYRSRVDGSWRYDIERMATWGGQAQLDRYAGLVDGVKNELEVLGKETNGFRDASDEQRAEAEVLIGKVQVLEGVLAEPEKFAPKGSIQHPVAARDRRGPDMAGVPRNGFAHQMLQSIGDGDWMQLRAALDGTSGGTVVQPYFEPTVLDLPQRGLFLRSLIPTTVIPANQASDQVAFVRQTVATQNAAAVAAGSQKPTSVYTMERVSQKFSVIAHMSEAVDKNFFSDFASLSTFLESEMRLGLLLAEEGEILSGSGTFPHLPGIINTAGIQTQALGADVRFDAVHKAVTKIRLNARREPDAVAFHPTDWETLRLTRTTQGEYISADPLSSDPNQLWGMKVVTSSLLTQGTAVVAYWPDMHLWVREDARMDFRDTGLNSSGQDMFSYNQLLFRAEERVTFSVIRPLSVCLVTGL